MSSLKQKTFLGTLWTVGGQFMSLLIVFVTNIVLARILGPHEFGRVAIILFFVTVSNVLVEGGLGGALVRKKDATKLDYSTIFVFNFTFSILLTIILICISPIIANFYDDELLSNLLIVSSSILIINSFQFTQNAKMASEMKFKEKFIYRIISSFLASCISIIMAYKGYGVWSLVVLNIATALFNTILINIFEGFMISWRFSKKSFKDLYAFGMNTSLALLIDTAFENMYQLILAKSFSTSQTGYYYQAKKIQDVPGGILNMLTQSVFFSALSKIQDDKLHFKKSFDKITLFYSTILGLASCCFFIYAENIIKLLYGNEWIGAVFYMKTLTIASFFYLQELLNRVIFKVYNQTRAILYLEFVKKSIQIVTICIGLYFKSIEYLMYGYIISCVFSYSLNFYYSRKHLIDGKFENIWTVFKVLLSSALTILIFHLFFSDYLHFYYGVLMLPIIFCIYFSLLWILKVINIIKELKEGIKQFKK